MLRHYYPRLPLCDCHKCCHCVQHSTTLLLLLLLIHALLPLRRRRAAAVFLRIFGALRNKNKTKQNSKTELRAAATATATTTPKQEQQAHDVCEFRREAAIRWHLVSNLFINRCLRRSRTHTHTGIYYDCVATTYVNMCFVLVQLVVCCGTRS